MIEVVFPKLRPEGLELIASHASPGSGGGLVQEDGGDGTTQAVAGPARDILVLAEGRLPLPGRGSEELVVLQQRRRSLEARDHTAVVLVGADPGQVIVDIGKPGGVVAGLRERFEQPVGAGQDDVDSRRNVPAGRAMS